MKYKELPTINRYAIIVEAKQAFIDWINSTPGPSGLDEDEDLAEFQAMHTSVFLIPEHDMVPDSINWFKKNVKRVFGELCNGWYTDSSYWPKLTWSTFEQMFSYRLDSLVLDLAKEDIYRDE